MIPGRPARILVTGSRVLADYEIVRSALAEARETYGPDAIVVHGGAPGADLIAHRAAHTLSMRTEPHPARWRTEGRAAGILRNQRMVELGADVCLAFPVGASRGTRDCMRRAEAAGIPVRVFEAAG
jgi:hypothetical protein